jgi:hypothetical protein
MKDIGACTEYLDIEVICKEKERSINLLQSLYTTILLEDAGF